MRLPLDLGDGASLRALRPDDVPVLARRANDRRIWLQLRDRFPHPYTEVDARRIVAESLAQDPPRRLAIAHDDELAGIVGLDPRSDVERISAEIGFWVAGDMQGRGLASRAVGAATRYAIETFELRRVYGVVYEGNAGSCRVFEKAGYALEGRLKHAALKDGRVLDQLLYAFTV